MKVQNVGPKIAAITAFVILSLAVFVLLLKMAGVQLPLEHHYTLTARLPDGLQLVSNADVRSSGVKVSGGLGPGYAVIGLLGVAVLFVSVYVLTSNTISDRQSKLATLQTQVTQTQAQAGRLTNFRVLVDTFDLVEQTVGYPIHLPRMAV